MTWPRKPRKILKMDELDELRRKKLEEIREQRQQRQQIANAEEILKQFLDKNARERYGTLKVAHAEKAMRLLAVITQMVNEGHIRQQITDAQLKDILRSMDSGKTEFRIKR